MASVWTLDLVLMVPPTFDYLPELFWMEPGRGGLDETITGLVNDTRRGGKRTGLVLGPEDATAGEIAGRLEFFGTASALVLARPLEERAARVLAREMEATGRDTRVVVGSPEELAAATRVALDRLQARGWPPVNGTDGTERTNGSPEGPGGVADRSPATVVLDARTTGPVLPVPRSAIPVLLLPDDPEEMPPLTRLDPFAEGGRLRFCFAAPPPGDDGDFRDGASWARTYRLHDPGWRALLPVLTARWRPDRLTLLGAALAWEALGIDPLLEMYAGNSLVDRNAELLVNIVPPPEEPEETE